MTMRPMRNYQNARDNSSLSPISRPPQVIHPQTMPNNGYINPVNNVTSGVNTNVNNSVKTNTTITSDQGVYLLADKRILRGEDLVNSERPSAYGSFTGILPNDNSNRILKEKQVFDNSVAGTVGIGKQPYLNHSPGPRYDTAGQKYSFTDGNTKTKMLVSPLDVGQFSVEPSGQTQLPQRSNNLLAPGLVATPSKRNSSNNVYLKPEIPFVVQTENMPVLLCEKSSLLDNSFEKKINMLLEENYKLNVIINEKTRNSMNCVCSAKSSFSIGATNPDTTAIESKFESKFKGQIDSLKQENSKLKKINEIMENKIKNLIEENNRMAEAWSEKTRDLESIRDRGSFLVQKHSELEDIIQKGKAEIDEQKTKATFLEKELSVWKVKCAEMESKSMDRLDNTRMNKALEERFDALNEENIRLQKLLREKEQESEKNETKILEINKKISIFEQRFTKCIEEKNYWEERANNIEQKIIEESTEYEKKSNIYEQKLQGLNEEISNLKSEKLREKCEAENIKYYQQRIGQIIEENDRLNKIIDEYDMQVCEKAENIRKIEEDKSGLLKKNHLLSQELNLCRATMDECKIEIEKLTSTSATSVSLTKSLESKIKRLEEESENHRLETRNIKEELKNSEEKSGFLHRNNENLNELLRQKILALDSEKAQTSKLVSEKQALISEKQALISEKNYVQIQINDLEHQITEMRNNVVLSQQMKLDELISQQKDSESIKNSLSAELQELAAKITLLQDENNSLKSQLELTNKSLIMQGTELMEYCQRMKELEIEKLRFLEDNRGLREQIQRQANNIDVLGRQLEDSYAEIDNLSKKGNLGSDTGRFEEEEQRRYIVEIEAKLKFLFEDHERLQDMLNAKMKEHLMETKSKNEIILKLEKKVKEISSELQSPKEATADENAAIDGLRLKVQQLEQENNGLREFKRKIFLLQNE